MGAPTKQMSNPFGQTLMSADIIKGLRRINSNIVVPLPEHYNHWYPYQKEGATCLWLGRPGEGQKITAFHLGAVPEWTLVGKDPGAKDARILKKGWRAIFDRVIKSRAASRRQIEREFRVSLVYQGKERICPRCFKEGVRRASDSAGLLCYSHERARKSAMRMREQKKEAAWNAAHPAKRLGPMVLMKA